MIMCPNHITLLGALVFIAIMLLSNAFYVTPDLALTCTVKLKEIITFCSLVLSGTVAVLISDASFDLIIYLHIVYE